MKCFKKKRELQFHRDSTARKKGCAGGNCKWNMNASRDDSLKRNLVGLDAMAPLGPFSLCNCILVLKLNKSKGSKLGPFDQTGWSHL